MIIIEEKLFSKFLFDLNICNSIFSFNFARGSIPPHDWFCSLIVDFQVHSCILNLHTVPLDQLKQVNPLFSWNHLAIFHFWLIVCILRFVHKMMWRGAGLRELRGAPWRNWWAISYVSFRHTKLGAWLIRVTNYISLKLILKHYFPSSFLIWITNILEVLIYYLSLFLKLWFIIGDIKQLHLLINSLTFQTVFMRCNFLNEYKILISHSG